MAKICKNCACYEVCFMANPYRTVDCNIGWQPMVVYCKECRHSYPIDETGAFDCCLHGMYVEPADYCSYGEREGENGSKQQG